jgi:ABC-type multidrug transport system ATPase subunit
VARAVSKRYGDRVVLHQCDFEVSSGSIALLAGANGAGKSTLLRCLAGLSSYQGEIAVLGARPGRAPAGAVAYLPQSVDLPRAATVGEVLQLFRARSADVPEGWLPPGEHRVVGELSGGEVQRVALAALIAAGPRVLLLDEPTADLDGNAQRTLFAWLAALRSRGATIVVTTPSAHRDELLRVVDRHIELERGRVATPARPCAAA